VTTTQQAWLRTMTGVTLVLLSLSLLGLVGTAAAQVAPAVELRIVDEQGDEVERISASGMYPTRTVEHTLFVDLVGEVPESAVALELFNLRDYENGCNRPEIEAGDVTCGPGPDQGELSSQLEVGISVGAVTGESAAPTCAGPTQVAPIGMRLDQLEDQVIPVGATDGVASVCVVLSLHFPSLPENNLAQGDTAMFDLRVGLTEVVPAGERAGDGTDVADTVVSRDVGRPGPGHSPEFIRSTVVQAGAGASVPAQGGPAGLARTGLGLLLLCAAGAGLLAAGTGLVSVGRTPRRPAPLPEA
jgi:hypothetical protein